MYRFLFVLFRVVIKRRIGSVGMADILILVIVADAAQNGMSGECGTGPAKGARAAAAGPHRQRRRS
jgi:hypothetical protein